MHEECLINAMIDVHFGSMKYRLVFANLCSVGSEHNEMDCARALEVVRVEMDRANCNALQCNVSLCLQRPEILGVVHDKMVADQACVS